MECTQFSCFLDAQYQRQQTNGNLQQRILFMLLSIILFSPMETLLQYTWLYLKLWWSFHLPTHFDILKKGLGNQHQFNDQKGISPSKRQL